MDSIIEKLSDQIDLPVEAAEVIETHFWQLLLVGLALALSACSSGPDIGETAVAMHAASFSAPSGESLEERQYRLMQFQRRAAQRR